MALLKDMEKTSIIYIGQYKGFKQMGPSTPIKGNMSSAPAILTLSTVFLLDNCVEVIIQETDPGRNQSSVHKSMRVTLDSADDTNDIRFVINRCFND